MKRHWFVTAVLVATMADAVPAHDARAADLHDGVAGTANSLGDIPCLIEPHQSIKLSSAVQGVLDTVAVDRGDPVHKGMVVAHFESGVQEAELAAAGMRAQDLSTVQSKRARLDFLEAKRTRLMSLRGTSQYVSLTSIEEVDSDARQARADLETAETNLRLARVDRDRAAAQLAQRTIRSPVEGVVTEKASSVGEYISDQSHIFTVAEIDPLNIELYLPTADYRMVREGMHATVTPAEPVGGHYDATVAVIDQVLDSRSGTFGVRLSLPNPDGAVPAGIRCQVHFSGE